MDISYIGHSCFKIKGKKASVVFDPYDPEAVGFRLPKTEADIVCVSHEHEDHNNATAVLSPDEGKNNFVIRGPGEYDLKDIYVRGFKTFHDDKKGAERGKNTIYYVEIDGFFVLHLGDLGHKLDKDVLEEIEKVDVLFIPVGGVYTIDHEVAVEVISQLEPSLVVPMHYQTDKLKLPKELNPVDKFTEEWGSAVESKDKLKISSRADLPEKTEVVILES